MLSVDFRDVTADAPAQLHFPEYVRGFEDLGFVRLGRAARVVLPRGHGSAARYFPKTDRATFLRMTAIPLTVLAAPDGSAFVLVDWWWGMPEVRLRTALTTGAVVETRRSWDAAPVWPEFDARAAKRLVLASEQCKSATRGRDIHLVAGGPSVLWRAHQVHVDTYRERHRGEPATHQEISAALGLSRRLAAHDLLVQRRREVVTLAALVSILAVMITGIVLSPAVWLWAPLLVSAVEMLVLAWTLPRLTIWLRYEPRLRPKLA